MYIRPKAYLQVLSRRLHIWLSHLPSPINQEASPPLIFIAAVLALLLAILEVDLHGAPLQSLGLTGTQPDLANFMGP